MSPAATISTAQQPDIAYAPDWHKYQARTQARLKNESLSKTLPPGFPSKLDSDLVWEGDSIADTYNWTFELSPAHVAEIESALAHFKSLELPPGHISVETFPLSTLHAALRDVSRELHHGHGFRVVRGMPFTRHSRADNVLMYAGVSAHVASQRGRQDHQFEGRPAAVVLTHITDLSAQFSTICAPAYTTDKQVFHTDQGDIVALAALSAAASGGTSRLASTGRVYNELAATRPDLIATLAADWTAEVVGDPARRCEMRPLLYPPPVAAAGNGHGNVIGHRNGNRDAPPPHVTLQYARRYFTGFGTQRRAPDLPPISEAQAEALDALHFLGERFSVGLDFRVGDIQFINNLAIFHARDAFTDSAEHRRHLIRLWLRDPELAWETPEPLRAKWALLYNGVTVENQVLPPEPFVRSASNTAAKMT